MNNTKLNISQNTVEVNLTSLAPNLGTKLFAYDELSKELGLVPLVVKDVIFLFELGIPLDSLVAPIDMHTHVAELTVDQVLQLVETEGSTIYLQSDTQVDSTGRHTHTLTISYNRTLHTFTVLSVSPGGAIEHTANLIAGGVGKDYVDAQDTALLDAINQTILNYQNSVDDSLNAINADIANLQSQVDTKAETAYVDAQDASLQVQIDNLPQPDVNKAYVDAADDNLQTQVDTKVDKVTGKSLLADTEITRLALLVNADVNKSYVDAADINLQNQFATVVKSINNVTPDVNGNVSVNSSTIDESNLVHKTDDESIAGIKTFTGKVGIGTTNPQQKLHVDGNIQVNGIDTSYINPSSGTLNTSGKLWVNGSGQADVLYFKGGPGGYGSTASIAFDATGLGMGGNVSSRISFVDDGYYGADIVFQTKDSGAGLYNVSEKVRINRIGNLGLGTSNPTEKIHAVGVIYSSTGGFKFPDGTIQTTAATGDSGGGIDEANLVHKSGDEQIDGKKTFAVSPQILLDQSNYSSVFFSDDNGNPALVLGYGNINAIAPNLQDSTFLVTDSKNIVFSTDLGASTPVIILSSGIKVEGNVEIVSGAIKFADGTIQSTAASGGGGSGVTSVNTRTGDVVLTKSDVSLSNVDNTSDVNKPVSTATQTALYLKADKTYVDSENATQQSQIDSDYFELSSYINQQATSIANINTSIGNKANLATNDKTNLVNAINESYTSNNKHRYVLSAVGDTKTYYGPTLQNFLDAVDNMTSGQSISLDPNADYNITTRDLSFTNATIIGNGGRIRVVNNHWMTFNNVRTTNLNIGLQTSGGGTSVVNALNLINSTIIGGTIGSTFIYNYADNTHTSAYTSTANVNYIDNCALKGVSYYGAGNSSAYTVEYTGTTIFSNIFTYTPGTTFTLTDNRSGSLKGRSY